MEQIVITASDIQNSGGWVLDTQFIATMGMPYLLAHGLGNPVEDASCTFEVSADGNYHVYVYTFNWVAPWGKKDAPGIFKLCMDEITLDTVFGASSCEWGWEQGGQIHLKKGTHSLTLHDLTGFEGRMGMIVLTQEAAPNLPSTAPEVSAFVYEHTGCKIQEDPQNYDIVICGAGMAGICAALSAARNGLKTALIQDRPVVGGNNSSEVRVWLGGETHFDPFLGVGNIINEMEQSRVGHYGNENQGENYEDDLKLSLLKAEKNITLYCEHIMTDVEMEQDSIKSIIIWDYRNKTRRRIKGCLFCDSTGDGNLGFLAGADFEVTTNGHMGMTNVWYVEDCGQKQDFPACPWAIDLKGVDFPGRVGVKDVYGGEGEHSLGCWFWEGGCEHDPIEKMEYTRDLNLRAMYGAWDALKNADHSYPNHRLGYASYIGGKRESRRLFGDVILTKNDVTKAGGFHDGCVPSTWNFDVHYPDRRFYEAFREGDAFITKDYHEHFHKPFFIPYRTLYSRNIQNMFMAGRNVSVSHDALGTVRVMRTCGMMGEVVGYAARICRKYEVNPRAVYEQHLEELLSDLKAIPMKKKNKLVANV